MSARVILQDLLYKAEPCPQFTHPALTLLTQSYNPWRPSFLYLPFPLIFFFPFPVYFSLLLYSGCFLSIDHIFLYPTLVDAEVEDYTMGWVGGLSAGTTVHGTIRYHHRHPYHHRQFNANHSHRLFFCNSIAGRFHLHISHWEFV